MAKLANGICDNLLVCHIRAVEQLTLVLLSQVISISKLKNIVAFSIPLCYSCNGKTHAETFPVILEKKLNIILVVFRLVLFEPGTWRDPFCLLLQ